MTPDAAHHFFILAVLALATILVIAAMRTFAGARRGRRDIVGRDGVVAIEALRADVGEVKARLATMETMLREVG